MQPPRLGLRTSAKPLQSLLANKHSSHWIASYLQWGAIVVGVLMVLVGAADVVSRVADTTLGPDAGQTLFAPAAAIGDPSVLNSVKSADASASASTSTLFIPTRIKVPSVGIDANVQAVGTRADGTMATPSNFTDTSWYKDGGHPGAEGNAVFAGHVNNALTTAGVFGHLNQVHLGDYVTVSNKEGRTLLYKVTAIDQYPADEAPADSIFAATGPSQIILITCDGDWVPAQKSFDKRLVITAKPAYQ